MTTTDTERLDFAKPDVGTEDNSWGALLNTIFDEIDKRTAGVTSITLSGNKTLSNSEYLHPIIEFTGNPGGDADVTFPDVEGFWFVKDGTTGGHTIGCTISGGTPFDLTAGQWTLIYTAGSSADVAEAALGLRNLVEDTTPQLGGNLDVNSNGIQFTGATVTDVTGADTKLVSGTAGTTGYTAKWNADGDLVDGYEVLDEDDMASDSATKLATQQSIKAYTDTKIGEITGFNAQTGTAYTAVLADSGKAVTMNNASANTFTIPTNASVAFPVGSWISIIQIGAGTTTVTGDTGVTVNGVSAGGADSPFKYAFLTAVKVATDEWYLNVDGVA